MKYREYVPIKEIGEGSFGKAHLVEDQKKNKLVLKTVNMLHMNSKQRQNAVNEVRVLASLKHPYIINYRESFVENRVLCIVMDYAEGGDLQKRIHQQRKKGRYFSEYQVITWFTQAALALKHIHEKKVLHRDLKSQNMFLTASDRLRIGDFGIAKTLDSTSAFAQTSIGTPYYVSPEICNHEPYSWASDMWALGCLLFEMAALRVPFPASNLKDLVHRIQHGPLPTLPAHYSRELQELLNSLLNRNPVDRPDARMVVKTPLVQTEIRRLLSTVNPEALTCSKANLAPKKSLPNTKLLHEDKGGSAESTVSTSTRPECSPAHAMTGDEGSPEGRHASTAPKLKSATRLRSQAGMAFAKVVGRISGRKREQATVEVL